MTQKSSTSIGSSAESIDERLRRAKQAREDLASAIRAKVSALQKERAEMNAQYDEELGALESELGALGINSGISHPTDIAVKAYNYLLEHRGRKLSGGALRQAVRSQSVVWTVTLAPYLADGRIKTEGERRARVYWVDAADPSAV